MIRDHAFNLDAKNRIEVHSQGEDRIRSFQVMLKHDHSSFLGEDYRIVAMFDHNEDPEAKGHDVVEEGLHIDIYNAYGEKIDEIPPVKIAHVVRRGHLGRTIRFCKGYLRNEKEYLVEKHLRG